MKHICDYIDTCPLVDVAFFIFLGIMIVYCVREIRREL